MDSMDQHKDKNTIQKCLKCLNHNDLLEPVQLLNCDHVFHKGCIQKWGINNNICPLCREKFDDNMFDYGDRW